MKRIFLVLALLAFSATAYGQAPAQLTTVQPSITRTFSLTTTSKIGPSGSPWISEKGTGVNGHTIVWTTSGTVSTCSVKVEKSVDGVTWADLIAGATCTSASATGSITTDIANYVRVNATTLTGSGTLNVTYFGFLPVPSIGTVEVDPTGLATSTIQTDGSQKSQVCDSGGDCATVTGSKLDVNASIDTTGLATAAKQDTGNTSLGSIDTKLSSQSTAAKQDTAQTSLSSIVTNTTGASTAAKQDTGNTSLGSMDTKLSSQATAAKQDTGNTYLASIAGAVVPISSRCLLVSAASNNATNCKASAGNLMGIQFVNTTDTLYYLRLYNLASAPTCSSSTGFIETIPIPASTTGAGIVMINPLGEAYSTGIGFCFTGGGANNDNSNADTGVWGKILYN